MGEAPKRVTLFGIGRLGICTALVLEKAGCGPLHPQDTNPPAELASPAAVLHRRFSDRTASHKWNSIRNRSQFF